MLANLSMSATPFFKGPEFGPLSSKDLISWIFDNQPYDGDKKVSDNAMIDNNNNSTLNAHSSISTPPTPHGSSPLL